MTTLPLSIDALFSKISNLFRLLGVIKWPSLWIFLHSHPIIWSLFLYNLCGPQILVLGAIHSIKLSGNFGPKLNGSVRSNRKSFEKTGPPFEVVLFSRSDRSEFWLNGSRPLYHHCFDHSIDRRTQNRATTPSTSTVSTVEHMQPTEEIGATGLG